mmetsp:Transcript_4174/g.15381  ORF Transcript_4174/g.15381 Transcript_4174/m.15381 type:complete len:255 (-) Transcript_4174:84-848(-)
MEDRPLIVQICGNDPSIMARAACLIEDFCNNKSHGVDAIDINLGCPQKRAAEGHYGSYLLEKKDWKLVQEIVESMSKSVNIPISCKIRLLQTESQTVEFAKLLEAAGCSLLAVHGRQRGSQRHGRKGPADLDQIAAVKRALTIPVIANGNVRSPEDIWINLEKTRADGIMSAEGLLANPAIFKQALLLREGKDYQGNPLRQVALEYLDLAEEWKVPMDVQEQHVSHILGLSSATGGASWQHVLVCGSGCRTDHC